MEETFAYKGEEETRKKEKKITQNLGFDPLS